MMPDANMFYQSNKEIHWPHSYPITPNKLENKYHITIIQVLETSKIGKLQLYLFFQIPGFPAHSIAPTEHNVARPMPF